MKNNIGLKAIDAAIAKVVENRRQFRSDIPPLPHFIVLLDRGNGQGKSTKRFAAAFKDARLRSFKGLDDYIKFTLDGTADNLNQVFADIKTHAVYTNDYEGIAAIDISEFVPLVMEEICGIMLKKARELGKHATLVFYLPQNDSRNRESLIARIRKTFMGNVKVIEPAKLSKYDLALICKERLNKYDIRIDAPEKALHILCELIEKEGIKTADDADVLGIRLCDLVEANNNAAPVLTISKIKSHFGCLAQSKGVKL